MVIFPRVGGVCCPAGRTLAYSGRVFDFPGRGAGTLPGTGRAGDAGRPGLLAGEPGPGRVQRSMLPPAERMKTPRSTTTPSAVRVRQPPAASDAGRRWPEACRSGTARQVRYGGPRADVAQWQSPSLPSWPCGFDSRHPLQLRPKRAQRSSGKCSVQLSPGRGTAELSIDIRRGPGLPYLDNECPGGPSDWRFDRTCTNVSRRGDSSGHAARGRWFRSFPNCVCGGADDVET